MRGAVAAALAVVAGLLGPMSIVSGWLWSQLSDTDAFVASYAGLAHSPQVQQTVTTRATAAITQRLGVIGQSDLAQQLVNESVAAVVASDAFAAIWEQTLRTSHTQLQAVLADQPGAIGYSDGALQLQLQPFADAVKQRLVDVGVPFADRLPTITESVPLIDIDPRLVSQARSGYRAAELGAIWLPWLALLCGIAAVLLWPNKRRALIVLGSIVTLITVAFGMGWSPVVNLAEAAVPEKVRPFAEAFFEVAPQPLVSPTLALGVAGLTVLFVGLMSRPDAIGSHPDVAPQQGSGS